MSERSASTPPAGQSGVGRRAAALAASLALSVVWASVGEPAQAAESSAVVTATQPSAEHLYKELQKRVDYLEKTGRAFELVIQLVRPSVVFVESLKRRKASAANIPAASGTGPPKLLVRDTGSGVIVSSDGYMLTNSHVVDRATQIKVRLYDGRVFTVDRGQISQRVWRDPETDLAVVRLPATGLPAARLGDSDRVQIGSWALAFGAPFGFEQTVTHGIISAKERSQLKLGDDSPVIYQNYLQTDAPVNPGNSGGPLVNLRAEVIGINTLIATRGGGAQGVGFAIPVNLVRQVMKQLVEHGEVVRGFIGAMIMDLSSDEAARLRLSQPGGALVRFVNPGLPADKAGVKQNDVIVGFAGKAVANMDALMNLVADTPVGKTVPIVVVRAGQRLELAITVARRTPERLYGQRTGGPSPTTPLRRYGLSVAELTAELARRLDVVRTPGVIVIGVEEGGPAWREGLRVGDVIYKIDDAKVRSVKQLGDVLGKILDPSKGVFFHVRRGSINQFFLLYPHPRAK